MKRIVTYILFFSSWTLSLAQVQTRDGYFENIQLITTGLTDTLYKELNYARTHPKEYQDTMEKYINGFIEYYDTTKAKDKQDYEYAKTYSMLDVEKRDPLIRDPQLEKIAQMRALDMTINEHCGHLDKRGEYVDYYISEAGIRTDGIRKIRRTIPSKKKRPIDMRDPKTYKYVYSYATNQNSSESCTAVPKQPKVLGEPESRYDMIRSLIFSPPHRNHLLSEDQLHKNDWAIGIGIARREDAETISYYCAVIIVNRTDIKKDQIIDTWSSK